MSDQISAPLPDDENQPPQPIGADYDASKIDKLEGLEAVRRRP